MSAVGVKPVPMIWNVARVRVTQKLVEMGVFREPLFCEVSVYGEPYLGFGHPATIKGLDAVVDFFPPGADWRWTVSVIGANAFAVLAAAIERGGDVAIGLHDYPYPELGFPTNAELSRACRRHGQSMGREVATAAEAREILEMNVMGMLDGKIVLITGAGSGIGKQATKVCVREGATVVAVDFSGAEKDTAAEVGHNVASRALRRLQG